MHQQNNCRHYQNAAQHANAANLATRRMKAQVFGWTELYCVVGGLPVHAKKNSKAMQKNHFLTTLFSGMTSDTRTRTTPKSDRHHAISII
jgi:hypothetical protein